MAGTLNYGLHSPGEKHTYGFHSSEGMHTYRFHSPEGTQAYCRQPGLAVPGTIYSESSEGAQADHASPTAPSPKKRFCPAPFRPDKPPSQDPTAPISPDSSKRLTASPPPPKKRSGYRRPRSPARWSSKIPLAGWGRWSGPSLASHITPNPPKRSPDARLFPADAGGLGEVMVWRLGSTR